MLLSGGVEKVVVFAHHRSVMAALTEKLARFGVVSIGGGTTPLQRAHAVASFQNEPGVRVFLGQLQAAGVGIDGLQTVASHVVFAEASWTPGENEQCVDRLHRHGQYSGVLAQFLVAPGSLDERILGTAIRKHHVIHDVLDGG